jgi:hypothetical protein
VGGSGERAIASWKDGGDSGMGGLMTIAMLADVSEIVDRSLVDESLCAEVDDDDDDEGGDGDGGGVVFSDGVREHSGSMLSSDLRSSSDDLALETPIEGQ